MPVPKTSASGIRWWWPTIARFAARSVSSRTYHPDRRTRHPAGANVKNRNNSSRPISGNPAAASAPPLRTPASPPRPPQRAPDPQLRRLPSHSRPIFGEYYADPYSLRERGAAPKAIGDDPDIVAAALHAIVAQPVDVFVMELYPNRPVSVIVPRHHLPLMIVEAR